MVGVAVLRGFGSNILLDDGVIVVISLGTASAIVLASFVASMLSSGIALAAVLALGVLWGYEAFTPVLRLGAVRDTWWWWCSYYWGWFSVYPFVEGYQILKHLVIPVLPPSLELSVHKSKLLLIVPGLRFHRYSTVHEELVWWDRDYVSLTFFPNT
jgi:hypothetical protein